MIALLIGKLIYKSPDHSIVDVNGIGYKIFTPLSTYYVLPKTGESVTLHIHTRVRAFGLTFQRLKVYNSAQNTVSVPCYPTYSYA